MKNIYYTLLVLSALTSGCTSAPIYRVSTAWDNNKLATLHIYRTNVKYHALNAEKPFFYIDGMEIDKLATGQAVSIEVLAGKHTITVKEPILFMPGYENGKLEINVVAKKEYYIRYSKDLSGVVMMGGSSAATTAKTTMRLVSKEYYSERK